MPFPVAAGLSGYFSRVVLPPCLDYCVGGRRHSTFFSPKSPPTQPEFQVLRAPPRRWSFTSSPPLTGCELLDAGRLLQLVSETRNIIHYERPWCILSFSWKNRDVKTLRSMKLSKLCIPFSYLSGGSLVKEAPTPKRKVFPASRWNDLELVPVRHAATAARYHVPIWGIGTLSPLAAYAVIVSSHFRDFPCLSG